MTSSQATGDGGGQEVAEFLIRVFSSHDIQNKDGKPSYNYSYSCSNMPSGLVTLIPKAPVPEEVRISLCEIRFRRISSIIRCRVILQAIFSGLSSLSRFFSNNGTKPEGNERILSTSLARFILDLPFPRKICAKHTSRIFLSHQHVCAALQDWFLFTCPLWLLMLLSGCISRYRTIISPWYIWLCVV